MDYKVTDLPALSFFTEAMNTDTGGNIDITFGRPSMMLEQIEEGNTPQYQHTNLRSERVGVREWGIAVGVTRRMIEDSRFNEVEMALNEARRAVDRHITSHVMKTVFGANAADSTFETIAIDETTTESVITDFSTNLYGGFFGDGTEVNVGRLNQYANVASGTLQRNGYVRASSDTAGGIALSDVTAGIDRIAEHGYTASHLFISPTHYKSLLDLGDFTSAFYGSTGLGTDGVETTATMMEGSPFKTAASNGVVGSLYGLQVVMNAWIPSTRFGIFDLSTPPAVYVQRRPLTVEEANPGFGIIGSYMSMRYGLKVVRPETGCIFINGASG